VNRYRIHIEAHVEIIAGTVRPEGRQGTLKFEVDALSANEALLNVQTAIAKLLDDAADDAAKTAKKEDT
jgi:hypothetical protein